MLRYYPPDSLLNILIVPWGTSTNAGRNSNRESYSSGYSLGLVYLTIKSVSSPGFRVFMLHMSKLSFSNKLQCNVCRFLELCFLHSSLIANILFLKFQLLGLHQNTISVSSAQQNLWVCSYTLLLKVPLWSFTGWALFILVFSEMTVLCCLFCNV